MKKVVSFINRKEGSGKTTIALNLAAIMANELGLKTAFLEYGEKHYDTEMLAEIDGSHVFDDNRDAGSYLLKKSGFYLFWCGEAALGKLIEWISGGMDVLIVDTKGIPPESIPEISDRVVIPGSLTPAGIKSANLTAQWMLENKYPASMIDFIVNKSTDKILSASDMGEVFGGGSVKAVLNSDKNVEETGAKDALFYHGNRKHPIVTELKKFAENVMKTGQAKKHNEILGGAGPVRAVETRVEEKKPGNGAAKRFAGLKKQVHARLIEEIDIKNLEKDALTHPDKKARIFEEVKSKIRGALDKIDNPLTGREEREKFVMEVFNEATGLGAIEELLASPEITEIMVNRHDEIYIEKKGRLTLSDAAFTDDATVLRAIERIVMPLGRRIDESMPYVDARLADGSRVNAIIPPLAIDGPVLTIRKFSNKKLTFDDLIRFGSVTPEAVEYLRLAVVNKKNILISGGTGSGKTTLLNVLSSFIPPDERIVTIEDSAELRLPQDHVVRLESRPPNIEGKGEVSIRDLVKNALRMRPDRIVVGECRGGETLDMLQAMNTGHEGSMTTVHANSPRDALSRLDVLVLMSGAELPLRAIREQVKSAIDIIIQQSRLKDGSRKITYISEITGMEGDTILMHNVFELAHKGKGEVEGKAELKRTDRV